MQEILLTLSSQELFGLSDNNIDNTPVRIFAGSFRDLEDYNSFSVTYLISQIELCSHPSLISAYDGDIRTDYPELEEFCSTHIRELSEISPYMTYIHTIYGARTLLNTWDKEKALVFLKYIGMIWARYYVGNFQESRMLTGTIWEERYQAILNDEVDSEEFSSFLAEIDNQKYENYYYTLKSNYNIHEQYKSILSDVMKKVRSIYGDDENLYI